MSAVLVVHDAFDAELRPDEADVLVQVDAVAGALRRLGHAVTTTAVGLDLGPLAARLQSPTAPDVVFNLVESAAGKGRLIVLAPALVEAMGVKMAGCSADSFATTCNKPLAKRWMALAGIDTPACWTLDALHAAAGAPSARLAVDTIAKSTWEHASIGLEDDGVFRAGTTFATVRDFVAAQSRRFRGAFFAEAFVEGREFNVALLDDGEGGAVVLPIAEIAFVDWQPGKPRIVGYRAKWDEGSLAYQRTERRFVVDRHEPPTGERAQDDVLCERLAAVAVACWRLFSLRGYARVDFRVDAAGRPWVLEVNANPCLASDAGFMAAAGRAGLDVDAVVARVMQAAR